MGTRKYPWDKITCMFAAKEGHLEVLQWARANGCPWHKFTCRWAAELGHLEILKWPRANGCLWDDNARDAAAKRGYIEPDQPHTCERSTLRRRVLSRFITYHFSILFQH